MFSLLEEGEKIDREQEARNDKTELSIIIRKEYNNKP